MVTVTILFEALISRLSYNKVPHEIVLEQNGTGLMPVPFCSLFDSYAD